MVNMEGLSVSVISENISGNKRYSLLRLNKSKPSKLERKKFLNAIMDKDNVLGIIEFFEKGGLVHKPIEPFVVLVISTFDKKKNGKEGRCSFII